MSKIGIVTVLYKSEAVLEDFFLSIASQTHTDYILYIVDNSPSIESELLIKKYCEQHQITNKTRYLPSKGNIGVAAGNNVGIKVALNDHCDYILLSNNDILITDELLFENMVIEANQNNKKLLVPKIYYYGTKEIWYISGRFLKFWAASIHDFLGEQDFGQHDNITECDYAPTCFMLIKADVFEKVGLMNENYFVYFDDVDFVYRCNEKGIKVSIYTKSAIQHKEGKSTGGATSDFSYYFLYRNRILFNNVINKIFFLRTISFFVAIAVAFYRAIKFNKLPIFYKIIKNLIFNKEYYVGL
jgi:GT2 family glycosyltransferase